MKGKLFYWALSFYNDIIYSRGVLGLSQREERRKFVRFNQFIVLALLVIFFSVVIYLYHKLFISAFINITAAYFFVIAYYLVNSRLKLDAGRILSVVTVNLYLIIMCMVEGLRAGDYLLFFPYFLALTFVVRLRRNFRELVIVYAITISSLILAMVLSPSTNDIELINDRLYRMLMGGNQVIAFVLTMVFSYAILRVNRDHEMMILQEKIFGETIYNTSLDGVFIVHAQSHLIASCNQRALEMFGGKDKSAIEGTAVEHWFEEEQVRQFIPAAQSPRDRQVNWQGELSFTTQTGKIFPAYVNVVTFEHKQSRYIKISILDISNVKMAEFELMKAKELAESAVKVKSRFLSNMSHELRTPLNGIIGATNLLLQEEPLPAQRPFLDTLKYSSEHMMLLINDILDYNKIEAGKLELAESPLNLKTFVDRVAAQFSGQLAAKKLHFHFDAGDPLNREVLTDETRLNQILGNLLSNAIKFTERGTITFAARVITESPQRLTVQFIVRDTGIGIPSHKHREIFESFTQADADTTRKYGGTGLGLAITRNLIRKFNSTLYLDSEPGQGSTFHFSLELRVNNVRNFFINENKSKGLQPLTGVRILLAEDNPVNMAVALKFLEKWEVRATAASNGAVAITRFQEAAFDLLLIDLEMPETDGAGVVQAVRKVDPHVPVIAFTAAVYDHMETDLLQKGFNDFIRKPFRPEELHQKIAYWLRDRGTGGWATVA